MEYTAIGDVTAVEHPAADRAAAYGLEPILIDGNDADAVHAIAVADGRAGAGRRGPVVGRGGDVPPRRALARRPGQVPTRRGGRGVAGPRPDPDVPRATPRGGGDEETLRSIDREAEAALPGRRQERQRRPAAAALGAGRAVGPVHPPAARAAARPHHPQRAAVLELDRDAARAVGLAAQKRFGRGDAIAGRAVERERQAQALRPFAQLAGLAVDARFAGRAASAGSARPTRSCARDSIDSARPRSCSIWRWNIQPDSAANSSSTTTIVR